MHSFCGRIRIDHIQKEGSLMNHTSIDLEYHPKKIAVLFPGVGYHTDKPLLYYSKKLAKYLGFEILEVAYPPLPSGIKGSPDKMEEAFLLARAQIEDQLSSIPFARYDSVVFLSKSIGTALAASYAGDHDLPAQHVYYTPVAASFPFIKETLKSIRPIKVTAPKDDTCRPKQIGFHGTADSWAETTQIQALAKQINLPLHLIPNADHSLETGDVLKDLDILKEVMTQTFHFLKMC